MDNEMLSLKEWKYNFLKSRQLEILYLGKIVFKNQCEIKTISEKRWENVTLWTCTIRHIKRKFLIDSQFDNYRTLQTQELKSMHYF